MSAREAVVAAARSWLGTPYVHQADVKGHGADCAMLLVRVYADLGLIPADYDPRPYADRWYLHRDEELYLEGVCKFCRQVEQPQPGDVVLFKFGRTASHAGILVADDLMVHAFFETRRVELAEVRSLGDRFHSYWSVFK